jgi:hypothetical protein
MNNFQANGFGAEVLLYGLLDHQILPHLIYFSGGMYMKDIVYQMQVRDEADLHHQIQ